MPMHLTKTEAADIIEDFVEGRDGAWDWDDFTSTNLGDPDLNSVRDRCNAVAIDHPSFQAYCDEEGVKKLRVLVAELRASANPEELPLILRGWKSFEYRHLEAGGKILSPLAKWLVIVGFCITTPLALVGLYAIYWVFALHHMFIMGWHK